MGRGFAKRLGDRLRAGRSAKGLTQAKLAEAVGVSNNYISMLERGQKLPTIDTLIKLAKAADTSVSELLGDVKVADEWLDEVHTVARTIPKAYRKVTLEILRSIAATTPGARGR